VMSSLTGGEQTGCSKPSMRGSNERGRGRERGREGEGEREKEEEMAIDREREWEREEWGSKTHQHLPRSSWSPVRTEGSRLRMFSMLG